MAAGWENFPPPRDRRLALCALSCFLFGNNANQRPARGPGFGFGELRTGEPLSFFLFFWGGRPSPDRYFPRGVPALPLARRFVFGFGEFLDLSIGQHRPRQIRFPAGRS